MAKKGRRLIKAEVTTEHLIKRIAELQHGLDAAKLRIDSLEAAHIHYAPAQPDKTVWWRLWS
jgi:hypothetical protein